MPSAPPTHWAITRACKPHVPQHRQRPGPRAQGYDRRWDKLSLWYRHKHPLCRLCLAAGRVTPATQVDHIKPKRLGGTDDLANLQSLCHSCHSSKTRKEQANG